MHKSVKIFQVSPRVVMTTQWRWISVTGIVRSQTFYLKKYIKKTYSEQNIEGQHKIFPAIRWQSHCVFVFSVHMAEISVESQNKAAAVVPPQGMFVCRSASVTHDWRCNDTPTYGIKSTFIKWCGLSSSIYWNNI